MHERLCTVYSARLSHANHACTHLLGCDRCARLLNRSCSPQAPSSSVAGDWARGGLVALRGVGALQGTSASRGPA